jgi:hypothetical protein
MYHLIVRLIGGVRIVLKTHDSKNILDATDNNYIIDLGLKIIFV